MSIFGENFMEVQELFYFFTVCEILPNIRNVQKVGHSKKQRETKHSETTSNFCQYLV